MKQIALYFLMPILAISALVQCSNTSSSVPEGGFVLEGQITDGANLTASLVLSKKNNVQDVIAKETLDEEGNFKMELESKPEPGIYNFSIGQQGSVFVFNGSEDQVTIEGALSDLQNFDYKLTGSPGTKELAQLIQQAQNKEIKEEDLPGLVRNTENPIVGFYATVAMTRGKADFLDLYKEGLQRIEDSYGSENATFQLYNDYVQGIEKRTQGQLKVGDPAPEIEMENPDGKTYRLSDLKGNVVLLDFWASWCRPCRIANPKVVKVYDKYNDDGFTVFSVSLDGIDSRTKNKLNDDPGRIKKFKQQQKQRWVQAIEQDNLKWEYHVSDLKKWESEAAATYGVRSIPRTFLIDRDGTIAAINPRNDLEQQVKKLIN